VYVELLHVLCGAQDIDDEVARAVQLRVGEELGGLAVFLCSEAASTMTGAAPINMP